MFLDYNSSMVQVTSLKIHLRDQHTFLELFPQIHSGNGGINGPASFHRFPLQGQSILSIKICILES